MGGSFSASRVKETNHLSAVLETVKVWELQMNGIASLSRYSFNPGSLIFFPGLITTRLVKGKAGSPITG